MIAAINHDPITIITRITVQTIAMELVADATEYSQPGMERSGMPGYELRNEIES